MSRFASELRLENFVKLFTKRITDQEQVIWELECKLEDHRATIKALDSYIEIEKEKYLLTALKIEQEKEEKTLRKLKTKLYFYERELNNLRNNETD